MLLFKSTKLLEYSYSVIVFYRFATVTAPIQKRNLFKGDSILCQYQLYVYYILCVWYFMLMTEICILLSYRLHWAVDVDDNGSDAFQLN